MRRTAAMNDADINLNDRYQQRKACKSLNFRRAFSKMHLLFCRPLD